MNTLVLGLGLGWMGSDEHLSSWTTWDAWSMRKFVLHGIESWKCLHRHKGAVFAAWEAS